MSKRNTSQEWSYSLDEERFEKAVNSNWRDVALEAIAEYHGQDPDSSEEEPIDPEFTVYVGRSRQPDPTEIGLAEWVLDHIVEQDDYCAEFADDWPDPTKEQLADLDKRLSDALRGWLDDHEMWPDFFLVDNIFEVTYREALAGKLDQPSKGSQTSEGD